MGNSPDLSFAEITTVLPQSTKVTRVSSNVALVSQIPQELELTRLQILLAGTVKIAKIIESYASSTDSQIKTDITQSLASSSLQNKVVFAIGEWGRGHLDKIDLSEVKNLLSDLNHSARYLESPREGLSASVLIHQSKVQEIIIASTNTETYLAKTISVQNIDRWTKIDRSKPFAERKRGLLPPKIARIMVNLALGENSWRPTPKLSLWDPFCGGGSILIESFYLGITQIFGSDLDPKAVEGSRTNLDWFAQLSDNQFNVSQKNESTTHADTFFFNADATQKSHTMIKSNSLNFIVTEPFLGKLTPNPQQISNIHKGLEKLYLGAFKSWRSLLKSKNKIIFVTPLWSTSHSKGTPHSTNFHQFIDSLASIGYTTISGPYVYARPNAVVQREIWVLTYQNK